MANSVPSHEQRAKNISAIFGGTAVWSTVNHIETCHLLTSTLFGSLDPQPWRHFEDPTTAPYRFLVQMDFPLLMVQKSKTTAWDVQHLVNRINFLSAGARFLNHQQYVYRYYLRQQKGRCLNTRVNNNSNGMHRWHGYTLDVANLHLQMLLGWGHTQDIRFRSLTWSLKSKHLKGKV